MTSQEKFVYCRWTIRGDNDKSTNQKLPESLYSYYKRVLDSDAEMSDDIKQISVVSNGNALVKMKTLSFLHQLDMCCLGDL